MGVSDDSPSGQVSNLYEWTGLRLFRVQSRPLGEGGGLSPLVPVPVQHFPHGGLLHKETPARSRDTDAPVVGDETVAATRWSILARSVRFIDSAVKREGVAVNSSQVISHRSRACRLP